MIKFRDDIIRFVVGGIFIVAAILKLISIDEFEIYIFSFNILNFLFTTIFSRLLIAGELILGLFFIFKIRYRFTWYAIMTVQIIFTLFLIYVAIFRSDANCHCFGELLELSPIHSIVKNIVIIALLLLINSKNKIQDTIVKKRFQLIIVFDVMLVVFIVSPPDSIYKMIYSVEKEVSSIDLYNVECKKYEEGGGEDSLMFSFDEDKQLIAIVSAGCKYCNLGMKKLSLIMKKQGIDSGYLHVFIWGSDEGIAHFIEDTGTEDYIYWKITPKQAIDIAYGRFPIFIWMEDKKIVKVGDFRDIDDSILF